MARGILGGQAEIEPLCPAWEVWSLNTWTAREIPHCLIFISVILKDNIGYQFSFSFCLTVQHEGPYIPGQGSN